MMLREEKSRNKITLGQDGNNLVNLLAFNAILFVILKFLLTIYHLSGLKETAYYKNIFAWFTLPAELSKLSTRPWTFISHMFTHEGFFHFLGNCFWLFAFGYILQDLTGNRKLIPLYIYGGIVGAVFYVLAYHIFPQLLPALPVATYFGANASIMAIAVATTTVSPDYRIFPMINGGFPVWILTMLYVILDMYGIGTKDPGLYFAHIAGAGMGFLFIYQLRRENDWSEWMNNLFDWVGNLFNPEKNKKVPVKDEFFYKVKGSQPYKKTPNVTQKRIDQILDKINQKGFHFLTDEEKDILKRAANKDDL
jgi:membrane associated rhomboid family serine protease